MVTDFVKRQRKQKQAYKTRGRVLSQQPKTSTRPPRVARYYRIRDLIDRKFREVNELRKINGLPVLRKGRIHRKQLTGYYSQLLKQYEQLTDKVN